MSMINWMEQEVFLVNKQKKRRSAEYDKFRLIQDKDYLSDFDKEIQIWKDKDCLATISIFAVQET